MLLSMNGIDKSFSGVRVLTAASLDVDDGEVMALVGQNGAGKSTLIKILTGAYSRDAGAITFQGKDVAFLARPPTARRPASPPSTRRSIWRRTARSPRTSFSPASRAARSAWSIAAACAPMRARC